jgi:hypothetical protein
VNVVEAAILVVAFIAAVYLAVQNFYTTVTGYVAVIEARTSLAADALDAGQKVLFKPNAPPLLRIGNRKCLITPYYAECCGDVKYFVASGFPALLINATLYGYQKGYYLLVPSPSYMISNDVATKAGVKPLDCVNPATLYSGPASAFLVLPNGTVLISPTR